MDVYGLGSITLEDVNVFCTMFTQKKRDNWDVLQKLWRLSVFWHLVKAAKHGMCHFSGEIHSGGFRKWVVGVQ